MLFVNRWLRHAFGIILHILPFNFHYQPNLSIVVAGIGGKVENNYFHWDEFTYNYQQSKSYNSFLFYFIHQYKLVNQSV